MKIHRKILNHFQSCHTPVDKEGYLYKKGERNTSYQKRWFILKGNLLFYKDRPADRDLIGVIVLEGCSVQLCESEEEFAFSLVWSGPGLRTYKFSADDQGSQEGWIKALLSANHSYLALLVLDLEKQYREAMEAYSSDLTRSATLPNSSSAALSNTWLTTGSSSFLQYPGPGVGPGQASSPNLMLQAPPVSPKAASKRSPKLWPKRNANVVPINGPTPPQGEWCSIAPGTKEEFIKLHEDFGKEVKELIADWLKREGKEKIVQEEDLINFD